MAPSGVRLRPAGQVITVAQPTTALPTTAPPTTALPTTALPTAALYLRPAQKVVLCVGGQLDERAALLLQRGARRAAGREQRAVPLELEQLGAHHGLVRVRTRVRARARVSGQWEGLGLGSGFRLGLHAVGTEKLSSAPSAKLTSKPLAAAFSRTRAWIDCSSVLEPPWAGRGRGRGRVRGRG